MNSIKNFSFDALSDDIVDYFDKRGYPKAAKVAEFIFDRVLKKRTISLVIACFFFFLFLIVEIGAKEKSASKVVGITLAMATLWMTGAIPMAVTSLMPVVVFPICGVMSGSDVSNLYFNQVSMIFLGGFMFALAMERWNLHKRIGLRTMLVFGKRLPLLLLGFILTTYFMSWFISNTASALIMIPNAMAIITQLESVLGEETVHPFALSLALGIGYASSIGGIATLVGTPPNLSFVQILKIIFPDSPPVSFLRWMLYAVPLSFVFIVLLYIYFYVFYTRKFTKILTESSSSGTNNNNNNSNNSTVVASQQEPSAASEAANTTETTSTRVSLVDANHPFSHHPTNADAEIDLEALAVDITLTGSRSALHISNEARISSSINNNMNPQDPENGTPAFLEVFEREYAKMGRISYEESVVAGLFAVLAFLWMFRGSLGPIPGWSQLFTYGSYINDGTVAVAVALILFLVPAKRLPPGEVEEAIKKETLALDQQTADYKSTASVDQSLPNDDVMSEILENDNAHRHRHHHRYHSNSSVSSPLSHQQPPFQPSIPARQQQSQEQQQPKKIQILGATSSTHCILDWGTMTKFPWDLLLLFGGGFALADGFRVSGLSQFLGNKLSILEGMNPLVMVVIVCTLTTFLTEFTSNIATAQILLPILASLSVAINICPLILMIPATVSCSYAFMLVIATAPNMIVFATGKIQQKEMAAAGLYLNIVGIIITTVLSYVLLPLVFGFTVDKLPEWAVLQE